MMDIVNSRKRPEYFVHENGFIMPRDFNPENFHSAVAYVPQDGDIFIATYPKCGTTWLQNILYLMKNDGNPIQHGYYINQFIPFLEERGAEWMATFPVPRMMKTHLPYNLVPKSAKARYICVARNPKDCCVSFYHHTKGFEKYYGFGDGTFDDYFECFLEGQVDWGDYFDYLLSWFERRNDPNVLFLLYEDMKVDVRGVIKKIGEFLGGEFLKNVQDESILNKIVAHSSFETMKAAAPSTWFADPPKESEPFIRKGKVGDWRTHFSKE